MRVFDNLESNVRGYVRSFPAVFQKAKGSKLYDETGSEFIDFFAGAGTLNYGHNNDYLKEAMIGYLESDGILHGLDKATVAKKSFLEKFSSTILEPRNLDYKFQFTGPTGTNAIETALKIVRMVKGRSNVVSFTNAFHGLTMGSTAITGNSFYRDEAFINRINVSFMPYDGYFGPEVNTLDYFRKFLEDKSSGLDLPAAVFVETIQAEGGVNVASKEWLQGLEKLCRDFDMLLVVDEIQVGNGRSGDFFSFEEAGINPDIVTLSKSIGGGLPLAIVLLKPELDQWKPGEHTGTFRGNNLAFVASAKALEYWDNDDLGNAVKYKEKILKEELDKLVKKYPELNGTVKGRGLIYGIHIPVKNFPSELSAQCFENGLVIELAGADDDVLKFLPPLVIEEEVLREGIAIVDKSIAELLEQKKSLLTGELQK